MVKLPLTPKLKIVSKRRKLEPRKLSETESVERENRFHAAMKRVEEERERKEEEKWAPKIERMGMCKCGGNIVIQTSYISQFDPMMGPVIIGPGSKNQLRRVRHQECFCTICGITYHIGTMKKKI